MSSPRIIGLLALLFAPASLCAQQAAPPDKPSVTVAGVAFVQFGYGLLVDSSLAPPGHPSNFDVTRTFVHVLGHFGDGVSTRVTADIDGRKAAAGQLSFRLAYAFVSWQPGARGPLTWKIGLMHTPWNEYEEAVWDYRFQGRSVLDRNGYGNTADFGAGVDGNWDHDRINMQAGVYNGEGANAALGDQGKDVSARMSIRLAPTDLPGRVGGLRLSGYADLGRSTGGGAKRRLLAMLSYKNTRLAIAGIAAATEDSIAPASPHLHGQLFSIFATYNVPKSGVALIARLDRADPDTDNNSDAQNVSANVAVNPETRLIGGVGYAISPHLRVLLDVDALSVANGATNVFDRSRQFAYFHTEFKF